MKPFRLGVGARRRGGLAVALGCGLAYGLPLPQAPGCPVFPRDNAWNQRVDRLPVARDSARAIRSIGADTGMHADFGSGTWDGAPIGIPITVVGAGAAEGAACAFDYADESDRGPYPIPADVPIEGGGATGTRSIVDRDAARSTSCTPPSARGGGWRAGSGAIWTCARTACGRRAGRRPTRPACRSCPGSRATTRSRAARSTTRCASPPAHAPRLRLSRRGTSRATTTDPTLPPMGLRLRLRADFDRAASRRRRASCSRRSSATG